MLSVSFEADVIEDAILIMLVLQTLLPKPCI